MEEEVRICDYCKRCFDEFEDEMRVTVIATGFDENKTENKNIYSSANPASKPKAQPTISVPNDPASNIDDIDEIFKIFNK